MPNRTALVDKAPHHKRTEKILPLLWQTGNIKKDSTNGKKYYKENYDF